MVTAADGTTWPAPSEADLRAIATRRGKFWANGFRPLPVLSHTDPDRKTASKAPLGKDWPVRARKTPPEVVQFDRAAPHAANTGILCDGLRAVDIDLGDLELGKQVFELAREMLGDTITRRRDHTGRRCMLYRAAEGEAVKAVRAVLHASPLGQRLKGEDERLILDLLQQHPNLKGKTRYGVAGITVLRTAPALRPTDVGFHLLRTDGGPPVRFSFHPCFSGAGSDYQHAIQAMREAIVLGQSEFKTGARPLRCAYCPPRRPLLSFAEAQVHHTEPSFAEITRCYIAEHGLPETTYLVGYGGRFLQPAERARFVAFHDAFVVRVIACAKCNAEQERRR